MTYFVHAGVISGSSEGTLSGFSSMKMFLCLWFNYILVSQEYKTALFKTNIRKDDDPDVIYGRTLYSCADQLCEVFAELFNICAELDQKPTLC